MRTLAAVSALLSVGLAAFALWGMRTAAGRHAFDEMAGMLPFFAGVASAVLAPVAAFAWWRGRP